MNSGVLGTSVLGQTISAKLAELGHDVMIGTRDVAHLAAAVGRAGHGVIQYPDRSIAVVWKEQVNE